MSIELFAKDVTVEIVQVFRDEERIVGYVFASDSAVEGVTQEQRWVLYDTFKPINTSIKTLLRQPSEEGLRFTNLSSFQSAVRRGTEGPLWRKGATYVKVHSASHGSIQQQTPPPWPRLSKSGSDTLGGPGPIRRLPRRDGSEEGKVADASEGPGVSKGPGVILRADASRGPDVDMGPTDQGNTRHQVDDGPADILQGAMSDRVGWVFGTKIDPSSQGFTQHNQEHWVLRGTYQQPVIGGGGPGLAMRGSGEWTKLEEFRAAMQGAWLAEACAAYVITSCTYLADLPADP